MTDLDELNDEYGKNSRVVSVRLKGKALEYLEKRERLGAKPREIIEEALAAAAEKDDRLDLILAKLKNIEARGIYANSEQPPSEESDIPAEMKAGLLKLRRPSKRIED